MSLKVYIFVILISFICISKVKADEEIDADLFSKLFSLKFIEFFNTNLESEDLKYLRKILVDDKYAITLKDFPSKAKARNCVLCYSVAESVLQFFYYKSFENETLSKRFLNKLCSYTEINKPDTCQQEVDNYFPFIKFILEKQQITAEDTCDRVLQASYCFRKKSQYEPLAIEPPILLGSKKHSPSNSRNLQIIQLSDFHYDPYYVIGSSTKCGNWICCRGPKTSNETVAAGKWGGQPCDTPSYTMESLLKNAAEKFKNADVIYLTGDYVDHFDWFLTADKCIESIEFVSNMIKQYFPNTPIIPILGNHDTFPSNMFSPNFIENKDLSSEWLYKKVSNIWKSWFERLNDVEALTMFEKGGYYTVKLRPNFRIVALNSNVCFNGNLWLLYDNFFFRDQLEWLTGVLQKASDDGEKVHILSHVPSNDANCYRSWTKEFKKIVERYTHVITAQFNGHSHLDEFVIFYASENHSTAINVAWNGGGGTTFPNVYPNYKVYYVDDQTYDVVDFETWIFDLKEANDLPEEPIQWYREYSFKSNFNVTDLSPDSMDKFLKRMKVDRELLENYRRIKVKQSETALKSTCDSECVDEILSSITLTEISDNFDNNNV